LLQNSSVLIEVGTEGRKRVWGNWNAAAAARLADQTGKLLLPLDWNFVGVGVHSINIKVTSSCGSTYERAAVTIVMVDATELSSRRITIVDHTTASLTRRDEFGVETFFRPVGFFSYTLTKAGDKELMNEATNGMNVITPLEVKEVPRSDATWRDIFGFLDRCLAVGMMVHWSLSCFVRAHGAGVDGGADGGSGGSGGSSSGSGGSGGSSSGSGSGGTVLEKALKTEITRLRDHPAIFGWYLTDEPDRLSISVDTVAHAYRLVKILDPFHPVSAAFCSGVGE
jgi:uncharacterized membrane protein YgcG